MASMVGAGLAAAMARIKAKLARMAGRGNPPLLRVGFLEKAKYPDGTPVAMVAAIQNFGAPKVGIPPRPFFANMIKDNKANWGPAVGRILKQQNYDADKTLALMGEAMVGQLRQSITQLQAPALSPTTLMLRKMQRQNPALKVNLTVVRQARARVAAGMSYSGVSTKPLVWTGNLLNSADYEVTK